MNLPHRWKYKLGKTILSVATIAAFAAFGAAPTLRANDSECQERINKADHRLHEAIEHHGYRSSQAEHARHELNDAREHCWTTYHKWWDSDSQSWHTDRDWHDDDHEHYHEHP
jgi:hypothetical protein